MALTRFTNLNGDLIKNLPSSLREELIYLEDVIPDGIMASLYVNDPIYNEKRREFLGLRSNLLEKMHTIRCQREVLVEKEENGCPVSSRINLETDEKIQFIKKYPQFKQLIESIEFCDDDLNVIKIVPIDQYLAEN